MTSRPERLQRLRALLDRMAAGSPAAALLASDDLSPAERRLVSDLASDEAEGRSPNLSGSLAPIDLDFAGDESNDLFLNSIVENIPDMVFVKDAEELRFVRFNRAGEQLVGAARGELIGKNDFDVFPPDEAEFFTKKDREVLDGGVLVDIPEEPIHSVDGLRFLHTKKIPILDASGRPIYLLGISRDITEAKATREGLLEAQAELVHNDRRLRLLLHRFPGVLWTVDDDLRLASVAGGAARQLSLDESSVGKLLPDLLPPSAVGNGLYEAHRTALGGDGASAEFGVDERTFQAWLEPLALDEDGRDGVIAVVLDVTESRRLEAERGARRMLEAQRRESLGVMAGGIAHDFNNLLVGVLGNASLALEELEEGTSTHRLIQAVQAAAEKAEQLTRQVLSYSGRGVFAVEPIDVNEVINGITGLLDVSISRRVRLTLALAPDLPSVEGDATLVSQVVMNLLTNSADSLEGRDGEIRLTTSTRECRPADLEGLLVGRDLPAARYVLIEVTDNGSGMDEDTRRRMFEPYFSTKTQGHGLGLAAAEGIIGAHRGAIAVLTEPEIGTTVRLLFPVGGTRSARQMVAPLPPNSDKLRVRGRVLVVDDEESVRNLTRAALGRAGLQVELACDGIEALARMESYSTVGGGARRDGDDDGDDDDGDDGAGDRHRDRIERADRDLPFDVVLLDMTMPRMSGGETLEHILERWPGVEVVLTSGYDQQEVARRHLAQSHVTFIRKPYRSQKLVGVIKRAILRGRARRTQPSESGE